MHTRSTTVLVVGSTGRIGSLVVAEALRKGFVTRALVRDHASAARVVPGAKVVVGDFSRLDDTLDESVEGVDAVIFAVGVWEGKEGLQAVDYTGVRNILAALDRYPARIVLMSMLGVTTRDAESSDWKRRSERLVRATGRPYTIVRPGRFDHEAHDQHRIVMLQGDTRRPGDAEGTVSRQQIAQVLVACVTSQAARGKTFELISETGPAQDDLEPLFAALRADEPGKLDGVLDADNMPLESEPAQVRIDVKQARESLTRPAP